MKSQALQKEASLSMIFRPPGEHKSDQDSIFKYPDEPPKPSSPPDQFNNDPFAMNHPDLISKSDSRASSPRGDGKPVSSHTLSLVLEDLN